MVGDQAVSSEGLDVGEVEVEHVVLEVLVLAVQVFKRHFCPIQRVTPIEQAVPCKDEHALTGELLIVLADLLLYLAVHLLYFVLGGHHIPELFQLLEGLAFGVALGDHHDAVGGS